MSDLFVPVGWGFEKSRVKYFLCRWADGAVLLVPCYVRTRDFEGGDEPTLVG